MIIFILLFGDTLLGRFIIDDKVGCLVDQLDELPTIHFSDKIDFYELNEFLNRQESRIDRYKSYVNDPFTSVNDQLFKAFGTNFEGFLDKYKVIFTSMEMNTEVQRDYDYYYTYGSHSPVAIVPRQGLGKIVLEGQFLV